MNLDETFPALSENRQPPEPAFIRYVLFLFLILLDCVTSSLGVPLYPSPFLVQIPRTAFISKATCLTRVTKATCLTQVISNQISTGCGHFSIFDE